MRELSPSTSWGFDFNDFCEFVICEPNDEWQSWLSIHIGELLPDGRPRFRNALVLVARQQGKTSWARKLILFWMFIDRAETILSLANNRGYAKKNWEAIVAMAKNNPYLRQELGPNPLKLSIGDECFTNIHGSKYFFAATNRNAGRSQTLHRTLMDEIREHKNYEAWGAVTNAMNAVRHAQNIAISNQGDVNAVVLDSLRNPALEYIETGQGDYRLGLFEWSMPTGADVTSLHSLAMSNPDLGNRTDPEVLLAAARKAKTAGGAELASFKTEVGCQRVLLLNPAIDPDAWKNSGTDEPTPLSDYRNRVALCMDVSLDGSHASLVAAAKIKGKIHAEVIEHWEGFGCTKELREQLPDIVARVKPAVIGWFPKGPAASVSADMKEHGARNWPPRNVEIQPITAETAAVCMGLAEIVLTGELEHPEDPLMTAHVNSSQKLTRGDLWAFTRKNTGPIDCAYALAGAVHLARTMPAPLSPVVVL